MWRWHSWISIDPCRYYNSWIEVAEEPPTTDTDESRTTGTEETSPETNGVGRGAREVPLAVNSLSLSDNIEEQALKLSKLIRVHLLVSD